MGAGAVVTVFSRFRPRPKDRHRREQGRQRLSRGDRHKPERLGELRRAQVAVGVKRLVEGIGCFLDGTRVLD